MGAEIVGLEMLTTLDIPSEKVLKGALKEGMRVTVICGIDAEGKPYLASSQADSAETLWYLQRAIHRLMKSADEE